MSSQSIIKSTDIIRVEDGEAVKRGDAIIDEEILTITINGEKAFEMVFSMTHAQALSAGFLFTQKIIMDHSEIFESRFNAKKKECCLTLAPEALDRLNRFKQKRMIKGSSGGSLLAVSPDARNLVSSDTKPLVLRSEQVLSLIHQHWEHSQLFHQTGAVHSAGLCDTKKIIHYYEDIGRHNAVDKLAGSILLNKTRVSDKIVTLSCRMSLEIIGKIIRTRVPVVISNAAPTLSAVKLGEAAGLTMIGFAQKGHFNIYSHPERIATD